MLLSEILGVDLDTDFGVEGYYGKFRVRVNTGYEFLVVSNGKGAYNTVVNGATAYGIIDAAPDGIIHLPPPLTDEQREQLKAIWTLGGRWIAEDETGNVFAYGSKPQKIMICREWHNDKEGECFTVMRELSVCATVSWSDPEPLDIVQTLREAGVVVSEMEKTTDEGVE